MDTSETFKVVGVVWGGGSGSGASTVVSVGVLTWLGLLVYNSKNPHSDS